MKKFVLTPSIYCANTLDLRNEIKKLKQVAINWIHFDVMDGHFVENYALSPKELTDIKNDFPELIIDVHIMATDLINKVLLFTKADYLTFHFDSVKNKNELLDLIQEIKSHQIKVGIALDLNNEIEQIKEYLPSIDLVTFMSIKPGFTGQTFDEKIWVKIKTIEQLKIAYPHLLFQIDGGVRWTNITQLINYGLDLIVVGSLLFNEKNYQNVIERLENQLKDYHEKLMNNQIKIKEKLSHD